MEDGDAIVEHMEKGDPDLDPVWGLLVDAADRDRLNNSTQETPSILETVKDSIYSKKADDTVSRDIVVDSDISDSEGKNEVKTGPISNVVDKAEVLPEMFPLTEADDVKVTFHEISGCDAFFLDGVLTTTECQQLIRQADGLWTFWENDPARPRISFRNAHTIEVTHQELADRIWHRISDFVRPDVVMLDEDDPRFEIDIEGTWKPYATNPKLLLSRYLEGGHFSPHTDGTTVIDFNRRTFYSCVLFLNSSSWGGHTRLYDDEQMRILDVLKVCDDMIYS